MTTKWWQSAIGYQIYPRSFQDSNADGIGDIPGITSRLPFLKWLGVDFIWLNPIYQSPNIDNGYDISDFQRIAPEYGTLQDLRTLIKSAHQYHIRIIMDLVVNHTSDQHDWFKQARTSRDNPYHDFYIWQKNVNNKAPNDWTNFTDDSVWTYNELTNEWYFHLFATEQPDLNWENKKVRVAIIKMINWWADQNIDGFRLDALSHLKKASFDTPQSKNDHKFDIFVNNRGIEKFLSLLHQTFQSRHLMTVGEAGGVHADTAKKWTGPDGFIDMIFELEHQVRQTQIPPRADLGQLLRILTYWETFLNDQGWLGLYLENHDQPRSMTVYADNNVDAAKALATLLLTLRGTPFIYQGQELGMTNIIFTSSEQIDDLSTLKNYEQLIAHGRSPDAALTETTSWSRDNARTPIQWSNFGFSDNAVDMTKSWLITNPNTTVLNYHNAILDPESLLHCYRELIAIRQADTVLQTGTFKVLSTRQDNMLVFTRYTSTEQRLIIVSLSQYNQNISLPDFMSSQKWKIIFSTQSSIPKISKTITLKPYQAVILRK